MVPSTSAVGATIPGVPFPACHVTSVASNFGGERWGAVYLFARGSENAPCPGVEADNAYLALDRAGVGRAADTVLYGPIDCAKDCRIFGAPDIDADGYADVAVVVVDGTRADAIELYRTDQGSGSGSPFTPYTTILRREPAIFYFDWGGVGTYRSGAYCAGDGAASSRRLIVWSAELVEGTWRVDETTFGVDGAGLTRIREDQSAVTSEDELPAGGGIDLCGARVRT
jgi:hypothetical protein